MEERRATATAKWLKQVGRALGNRSIISIKVDHDGSVIEIARYPTLDIYLAGRETVDDFGKMLAHDAAAGTAAQPESFLGQGH
jgi:hypothetical protein